MEDYPWPEAVLSPASSPNAIRAVAHAIGVVNMNWAWCEAIHEDLIREYLRIDFIPVQRITDAMPNRSRSDHLKALASEDPDPHRGAMVLHFIKCFDASRENRNLFTHCPVVDDLSERGIYFSSAKAGVTTRSRNLPITTTLLVSVCDETKRLYEFGAAIIDGDLNYVSPETLTERFPLPRAVAAVTPVAPPLEGYSFSPQSALTVARYLEDR